MDNNTLQQAIIEMHIVSLIARRDKARSFHMNQAMQNEADLLNYQIKALHERLKECENA